MVDNNKKSQFPFRLRRIVYLLDTYFKPMERKRIILDLRDIIDRTSYIYDQDIEDHIVPGKLNKIGDNFIIENITHLGSYLTDFLKSYRIKRILEALDNLEIFKDLRFPFGFRLHRNTVNYLDHIPHTSEQREDRLIDSIYRKY